MTMGKWPSYGPACLQKINPLQTSTLTNVYAQTQEDVHVREVAFVVRCVKDSPGAQYMLEMASLSQDSATSTQLQKYVS